MGYLMRFFVTDRAPLSLDTLLEALRAVDADYRAPDRSVPDLTTLHHGALLLGELEITRPDEELFSEEIEAFRELVTHAADADARARVLAVLDGTAAIVGVEAEWAGSDSEPVLSRLDPLWDWLFAQRQGLLQMDGEGFYDADGLVLDMPVTI